MKEVDVVMLAYTLDQEVFDMTSKAIGSLRAAEDDIHFNVFVLESNPSWPDMGLAYDADVQVLIPEPPFNFNRYNNIGRELGQAEWVVFSNNDVVFHPGWCTAMFAAVEANPALRCLCPWDPEGPHTPRGTFPEDALSVPGYLVRVTFTGWCFMVKRRVFLGTGPFDERFDYYFADDDFAMTLRKHAVLNAAVPGAHVTHLAHVTSKKANVDIPEKYKRDQLVFKAKWGAQRTIAWKNRLVKYILRPLGLKGLIRKIYRTK